MYLQYGICTCRGHICTCTSDMVYVHVEDIYVHVCTSDMVYVHVLAIWYMYMY